MSDDSSKESLKMAFNPEIDEELAAMLETMPLPPVSVKEVNFTDNLELIEKKITPNLILNIPTILESISSSQDKKRGIYHYRSEDWTVNLTVRRIDMKELKVHKQRNKVVKKLKGVKIHLEETIKLNDLQFKLIEGTYFDSAETWTKVIIIGKSNFYVLTLKYQEKDRLSSAALRNKMINLIKLNQERKLTNAKNP